MRTCTLLILFCGAVISGACGTGMAAPTSTVALLPTVASLQIEGNTSFSLKGDTSQLKALATMSDGAVEDRTTAVLWSSSNITVASVSSSGMITAIGDGATSVTATLNTTAATKVVLVDLP